MLAAIARAQWLSLRNLRGASLPGLAVTALTSLVWYGLWAFLAAAIFEVMAEPRFRRWVEMGLPRGLAVMTIYWQFAPLLVASLGASLDLRKLVVYPIPERSLFWSEVALRLTTAGEMLLLLTGIVAGLLANPVGGGWRAAPRILLAAGLFTGGNLLLAAGLRNLIERLLSRRGIREIAILTLVLAATLPQLALAWGVPAERLKAWFAEMPLVFWPWAAAARLLLSGSEWTPWLALGCWVAVAYGFGRWQFGRSLRYDFSAAQATVLAPLGARSSRFEWWFRLPGLLPDPVGALVEKETRTLARTPRFRLVFIMGFTFGLLVWLPFLVGENRSAAIVGNFLTVVSVYALTLLGQVSYWNAFGFDRSAVLVYYAAPAPLSRALMAKNIAMALYLALEILLVTAACVLLGMPVSVAKALEAVAVTATLALYLFAAGNLSSVYVPRAMHPERVSQGGGGGRMQGLLLLVYPVAGIPVALAYLARYAFETNAAFYGVLGVVALAGAGVYWVAMDSAVRAAEVRRERIVEELARSDGPVASQ
jgi:ABC-2 type transport system permease protein